MTQTHMAREVAEIPEAAARFLDQSREAVLAAAAALHRKDPDLVVTVARGSSDHAATYLKYAFELEAGVPQARNQRHMKAVAEAAIDALDLALD